MRWTKGVDILGVRGKRLPRSQFELSFENWILNVQNEVWIKMILVWVKIFLNNWKAIQKSYNKMNLHA